MGNDIKVRTINDVRLFELRRFDEENGTLIPIEDYELPFEIKRCFYVTGVSDRKPRGMHAHVKTQQVLVCPRGTVKVVCVDQDKKEKVVHLDSPTKALFVPEMIWDEQNYLSEDSVLLVFANTNYSSIDYITDMEEFLAWEKR